jgi:hypothetical protein
MNPIDETHHSDMIDLFANESTDTAAFMLSDHGIAESWTA